MSCWWSLEGNRYTVILRSWSKYCRPSPFASASKARINLLNIQLRASFFFLAGSSPRLRSDLKRLNKSSIAPPLGTRPPLRDETPPFGTLLTAAYCRGKAAPNSWQSRPGLRNEVFLSLQ